MTYSEIAVALGISPDSARNLVRRKRWHRRPGNDGLARVDVPMEHLEKAASVAAPPAVTSTDRQHQPPIGGAAEAAASDLALSVLQQHIGRCKAEIEALKQELDSARKRASERDVAAAELATFSVVLTELRNERKYWRDQAERLTLALTLRPRASERDIGATELATFSAILAELSSEREYWRDRAERLCIALRSPQPRRWAWFRMPFRNELIRAGNAAEADPRKRSAREAAANAGLLPSAVGTIVPSESLEPLSSATTSPLDKGGPPITASELERALERLSQEIDDGQAAAVPVGGVSCDPIEAVRSESDGAP